MRVELPEVFAATHDLLVRLHGDGVLDGFRIDHPDGLTDPRRYLDSLAAATGGCWVVVEKILEGAERLPADWACAGTTGYDTLNRVLHTFVDHDGEPPLTSRWQSLTGDDGGLELVAEQSKRLVLATMLRAEVTRLVDLAVVVCAGDIDLRDFTRHRLTQALVRAAGGDGPLPGVRRAGRARPGRVGGGRGVRRHPGRRGPAPGRPRRRDGRPRRPGPGPAGSR